MVYVFLADGFEEIEALCPVDIMRRAGIEVRTTAIGTRREVRGAHNITVSADMLFSELHIEGTPELLMLPGGMPGATHLREHGGLCTLLKTASAAGSRLAAICAAPFILGELGLLEGREATCYPGFEERLFGAKVSPKDRHGRGDPVRTRARPPAARSRGSRSDSLRHQIQSIRSSDSSDSADFFGFIRAVKLINFFNSNSKLSYRILSDFIGFIGR